MQTESWMKSSNIMKTVNKCKQTYLVFEFESISSKYIHKKVQLLTPPLNLTLTFVTTIVVQTESCKLLQICKSETILDQIFKSCAKFKQISVIWLNLVHNSEERVHMQIRP